MSFKLGIGQSSIGNAAESSCTHIDDFCLFNLRGTNFKAKKEKKGYVRLVSNPHWFGHVHRIEVYNETFRQKEKKNKNE